MTDYSDEIKKNAMKEFSKKVPESSLDYNMQMVEPTWGKEPLPPNLKEKLQNITGIHFNQEKNMNELEFEDLSQFLGFYSRDLRLGNIDKDEFRKAEYYLNLANDLLKRGFIEPFIITLSRVATIVELSQSKSGFLRRRNNTLTTENFATDMNPQKKSLFGGKPK